MNKFELRLALAGISPTQSMEIEQRLKSEFNDVNINTLSNIGSVKGIGDLGIVGASTVISAVVSVILLIWTLKPKKDKKSITDNIKKSRFKIEEEYINQITEVYFKDGGIVKINLSKEEKYRLRIVEDDEVLSILGGDDN